MLAAAVSLASGTTFIVLTPFAFISPLGQLRAFSHSLFTSFFAGFRREIQRPLFGDRLRCIISGRLLHLSPVGSRAVYDHYNLIVLALLATIAIAVLILA